jgi:hypothetical protein
MLRCEFVGPVVLHTHDRGGENAVDQRRAHANAKRLVADHAHGDHEAGARGADGHQYRP